MKTRIIKQTALLLSIILCLNLLLMLSPSQAHAAGTAPSLDIQAKSALLMDANTGQILYEQNADEVLPTASMTKMMTEYLVMEAIGSGKIKWDDMVTISENAARVGGSGGLLAKGEQYTVKDLFYEMSIDSGNDGAVSLAEYVDGTEDNFVQSMNEKAKQFGLTTAHFADPTGLSDKTIMSARDTAALAYHLLKDDPDVLQFTSITQKKFRSTDKDPMVNWNWMLEGNKDVTNFKKYAYPGLDGLKTGHTDQAGYCFTGTANHNGFRLISVVMGTKSEPARFIETKKLLDYGFNNFEPQTVLAAKTVIPDVKTVKILKGIKTTVPVVIDDGVEFVVKKGEKANIQVSSQTYPASQLISPIKQGQVVGTVNVTYDTGSGKITKTVHLITTEKVDKASWFTLFFRSIGSFFHDIFSSITKGMKKIF